MEGNKLYMSTIELAVAQLNAIPNLTLGSIEER
jgi:hypothetical protein